MEQINSMEFYSERYCGSQLKFIRIDHVIHSLTDENCKHEIFNLKHNSTTTKDTLM